MVLRRLHAWCCSRAALAADAWGHLMPSLLGRPVLNCAAMLRTQCKDITTMVTLKRFQCKAALMWAPAPTHVLRIGTGTDRPTPHHL